MKQEPDTAQQEPGLVRYNLLPPLFFGGLFTLCWLTNNVVDRVEERVFDQGTSLEAIKQDVAENASELLREIRELREALDELKRGR